MLYEELGGHATVERLVQCFYDRVYEDDVLRPLFPPDRTHVEHAQIKFLTQLTGGPKQYDSYDPRLNLAMIHRLLPIQQTHALRWIELMTLTIKETVPDPDARDRLTERLQIGAANVLRICEAHQSE